MGTLFSFLLCSVQIIDKKIFLFTNFVASCLHLYILCLHVHVGCLYIYTHTNTRIHTYLEHFTPRPTWPSWSPIATNVLMHILLPAWICFCVDHCLQYFDCKSWEKKIMISAFMVLGCKNKQISDFFKSLDFADIQQTALLQLQGPFPYHHL